MLLALRSLLGRGARATACLATGIPMGVAALAWVIPSVVLNLLLSITRLGPYVFLASATAARGLAQAERRRIGWMSQRAIAAPYRQFAGTWGARGRDMFTEPTTWRDAGWLTLLLPIGLASLVPIVIYVVTAAFVLAPAWVWAVPNPHPPAIIGFFVHSWSGRSYLTVIGLVLLPAASWLTAAVARGQARLATSLLHADSQQRLAERAEQLVATRARVVDAQAAELRRIERDLHDGAQARIVAAGMTLALADRRLRGGEPVIEDITTARRQLDNALLDLRQLVRGIHPPILTDRGLYAALSALAADNPLPVTVRIGDDARLPPAVESAAYFVVAEALTNAAKHSGATQCLVELDPSVPDRLLIRITDDGKGGADITGAGLDGIRRRVEALDGALTVDSPAGGPTVVAAELPCAL
jgi:signal transduction histidine kinase